MQHRLLSRQKHRTIFITVIALFAIAGTALLAFSNAGPQDPNDPNYPLADTNGDLTVNIFDLSYTLNQWNSNDPTADFNSDGSVNILDLSYLLAQWGRVDEPDSGVDPNPNAIYVSTDGNDGNDGTSESQAFRTISRAANVAQPGQTIYVKAGTYSGENITFDSEGTSGNPITLEGYKNTPGDRPTLPNFGDGSDMQPSEIPILDGGNRASAGIAIRYSSKDYMVIRNLVITRYRQGIRTSGSHHSVIDSVYMKDFGVNDGSVYSGTGMFIGDSNPSNNNLIQNSVVVNAGAENYTIGGSNNIIDGVKSYGSYTDGNNNEPDYYMNIFGDDNIIRNSHIERYGNPSHGGHGFEVKGDGQRNLFENNTTQNLRGSNYSVRHRGARNNIFRNNVARNAGFGITIRDGANDNLFENIQIIDSRFGMQFEDTTEDGGQQWHGNNNTLRNITITNATQAAIHYANWSGSYADSVNSNNTYDNITVDGAPVLVEVLSIGSNNLMRNSTIRNVNQFAIYGPGRNSSHLGIDFENNMWSNNGFSPPN